MKNILKYLKNIIKEHETPFYIYDADSIVKNVKELNRAGSLIDKDYKNFFAVKALPNPHILKLLKKEGMGFDCSSLAELVLVKNIGVTGSDIFFSSNNTPLEEYKMAYNLGAYINLDDINHIYFLKENNILPERICIRYNPGEEVRVGNKIIGKPKESKFGVTREQMIEGFLKAKELGVSKFGIHAMVVSNELSVESFSEISKIVFKLVKDLEEKGIKVDLVNLGGGFGIPYRPEDKKLNYSEVFDVIKKNYENIGLSGVRIVTENGRAITGPYGHLVSKVRNIKETYKNYVGLDACMSDLMRPGMYGAYHHISTLNESNDTCVYDVVGNLCENNDKFAIDRELPKLNVGDVVIIHDVGAHGHTMGFNYNGRLRCAEFLCIGDSCKMIRRKENLEDYFKTIV